MPITTVPDVYAETRTRTNFKPATEPAQMPLAVADVAGVLELIGVMFSDAYVEPSRLPSNCAVATHVPVNCTDSEPYPLVLSRTDPVPASEPD
jgi:hypothetical protein